MEYFTNRARILEQSLGARNRIVVPARQPMYPGGPVRQPYSYSVPSPHTVDCYKIPPLRISWHALSKISKSKVKGTVT